MADQKVHPMHTNPTGPPYSSSMETVAVQMPDEKSMKKQSLMHVDGYNGGAQQQQQQQQQKDFVYKMPAPLPPDHPSQRAGRRSARRGCCRSCCCCLGILCAILATIIIILGIAALVIYLVLKPKSPNFSVSDATITSFNLSSQPVSSSNAIPGVSLYLNADVTFDVRAENPNKKIGIYYDAIDVSLFYEDENIGTGSIPPFYQGHKNTTLLLLHMQGEDVGMTPSIGSTLQTSLKDVDSTILLHSQTMAKVRIKIGSWKSRASKFQINCDVQMSNPTAPNPHLLSKSCSFKLKKLRL